jgi:hypothetical protein
MKRLLRTAFLQQKGIVEILLDLQDLNTTKLKHFSKMKRAPPPFQF